MEIIDTRQELQAAEEQNYKDYEKKTARRLTNAAWRSLDGWGEARSESGAEPAEDIDRSAEASSDNTETLSLNLFLKKPEDISDEEAPEEIDEIGEREEKAIRAMRKVIKENFLLRHQKI